MNRVLVLAYHFPPVGGAGVQRSLVFVRQLPDFGYEPIVVTGSGAARGRWTPSDSTLESEISADSRVIRPHRAEPAAPGPWRRRAERWLRLEPAFARWWRQAVAEAGADAPEVDLVYASMSPFETAAAAADLARRLDVPWVADLRDPWALDEMTAYPTRLHRLLERRSMTTALATAEAIVMNTADAADAVSTELPELRRRRIVTITNGFDAADFARAEPLRSDGCFRVVHSGYLHTELGRAQRRGRRLRSLLGGSEPGVDILLRSHVVLLEAATRLVRANPELRDVLELHFAGVASREDRMAAERSGVRAVVHGYLPHDQSVDLVRSADLLYLPMHDLPPGRRARIVPGKTYEYLASGRPLLAALPDGDARELLARASTATICRPGDVDGIAAAVAREVNRFERHGRARTVRPEFLSDYERRHLTARLATLFDDVLRRRPPRRVASELAA